MVEMVSPLDSGDRFTPGVYDVKPSTEQEGEDAKEADVCNETENKMNIGKCQFVLVLDIALLLKFMMSNLTLINS